MSKTDLPKEENLTRNPRNNSSINLHQNNFNINLQEDSLIPPEYIQRLQDLGEWEWFKEQIEKENEFQKQITQQDFSSYLKRQNLGQLATIALSFLALTVGAIGYFLGREDAWTYVALGLSVPIIQQSKDLVKAFARLIEALGNKINDIL